MSIQRNNHESHIGLHAVNSGSVHNFGSFDLPFHFGLHAVAHPLPQHGHHNARFSLIHLIFQLAEHEPEFVQSLRRRLQFNLIFSMELAAADDRNRSSMWSTALPRCWSSVAVNSWVSPGIGAAPQESSISLSAVIILLGNFRFNFLNIVFYCNYNSRIFRIVQRRRETSSSIFIVTLPVFSICNFYPFF